MDTQKPAATAQEALQDLSVTPVGQPSRGTQIMEADYLNAVEDTMETKDISNQDLEDMGVRADKWAETLEKPQQKVKKAENPPELPKKTQEHVPARGTPKTRGNKAAQMARAMLARQNTRPPLKEGAAAKKPPAPKRAEKHQEEQEEQKEVSASTAAAPQEEEEEALIEQTPITPTLGDEGFPEVPVPDPSSEYRDLSVLSSRHEDIVSMSTNMHEDLSDMGNQVRNLVATIQSLTNKIGTMEAQISEVKKDKSSFMSDALDRIRALERRSGNDPSAVTLASSVVPSDLAARMGAAVPTSPVPEAAASLDDIKARIMAHKRERKY